MYYKNYVVTGKMLNKLDAIKLRFDEIADLIIQPNIIVDQKRYIKLNKEYKDLERLVEVRKKYKYLLETIKEAKEIIANEIDEEMLEMAKVELEDSEEKLPQIEEEIKFLLISKDPEDCKNAIVEIRAGTGGDEASIFAGDLYRMYSKYCENKNWNVEIMDISYGNTRWV